MSTTTKTSVRESRLSESNQPEPAAGAARASSCCDESMGPGFEPRGMCPMAGMCAGMMKPGASSGWLLLLPGALLVAVGLLVILVPKVIVWLLGGGAIFMGVMLLFMASRMRAFMVGLEEHAIR